MGKLGKKQRKFVKKHLKSVIQNRRKFKAIRDSQKRRRGPVDNGQSAGQQEGIVADQLTGGNMDDVSANGVIGDIFFNGLVSDDEDNALGEDSGSDSYLSEGPNCPYISGSEDEIDSEDKGNDSTIRGSNCEIHLELAKQKKMLNRLKKKDPNFLEFLEKHKDVIEHFRNEEIYSDEEIEENDKSETAHYEYMGGKTITGFTVDVWCWLVMKQPNTYALAGLLNGYRTACHYCLDDSDDIRWQTVPNGEVFSKILMFVLYEADGIFRRCLGVSASLCKEDIMKLEKTAQWKSTRLLIKSYLRSTLFLLNQLTDNHLLLLTLSRLRVSVIFFAAFPSLVRRLVKIAVHLWATGEESLCLASFLIVKDIALQLSSSCFEECLTKIYRAFISHCKFVEPQNMKKIENLGDSVVELYSFDVHRSYQSVLASLQQLAGIVQHALKRKQKEEFKKIYNWQFMKCIDVWVKFISLNIRDYDLQPLLYLIIQIIRGVAHLFPGLRCLPLRLKCVQMLNQLSSSSGIFIPVTYMVLDFLEYKDKGRSDVKQEKTVSLSSILKVPKPCLKTQEFQEECILSSIQLLAAHFSQWSFHIAFPDLATIPLILLKRFYESITVEHLRRPVKRLIDQVEQNSMFVGRKRDEVSSSVNDQASIESFLQMEKCKSNAPFTMYYNSILKKSVSKTVG